MERPFPLSPNPSPKHLPGFTGRALAIGLILVPLNAYWIAQMERNRQTAFPTVFSLFFNAVFILLVISLINRVIAHFSPRGALRQAELLLIYSMLCISTAIAGIDFIQTLMPLMSYTFWGASPENHWDEMLNPHMPKWLVVQDRSLLKGYYEGGGSFYEPHIVAAWIGPVVMWSLFVAALLLVMVCINVLLRRRWLDGEHLACPIVRLPVDISEPRATLFRSRVFWLGFGLAGAVEIYNALAFYYPTLPPIPLTEQDMGQSFKGRPWSAIGWMPRSFYPFLIGLGYMMPADFLFSSWFFYLFWKAELVVSAMMGLDQIRGFPFANHQGFGAYSLFAVYGIWLARGHLKRVWATILGGADALPDSEEPLRYRIAAGGIVLGLAFVVWFSMAMGMRFITSIAVFVIYYILSLSIARVRAQFGTPIHDLHFTGPDVILSTVFGTRAFPKQDLVGMGLLSWFSSIFRSHPMPHQMEALKMQQQTGGVQRGVVLALMLAALVGALCTMWSFLHIYYGVGALAKGGGFNLWPINTVDNWLKAPQGPQWTAAPAIGAGLAFALFLQTMRMRYVNWPFHPLGFAIAGNLQMGHAWMPLLVAWAVKAAITKYGGHKAAAKSVPFFLGFILADFVVISALNIVCIALHIPCYRFVD